MVTPSADHRTTLSSYIFATNARIDNRKNLLNSNIFPTCLYNMVNFGYTSGTRANFNGFRVLASLQRRRSPEANQTLHDVWRLLGCYTMYTFLGAVAPDGISPRAKFTLRPSLAFSYVGSVTARHSSKLCGVVQGMELPNFPRGPGVTYIRLGGHHVRWATAHILVGCI